MASNSTTITTTTISGLNLAGILEGAGANPDGLVGDKVWGLGKKYSSQRRRGVEKALLQKKIFTWNGVFWWIILSGIFVWLTLLWHNLCSNVVKFIRREIGEIVRYLPNETISAASQTVATALIAPKIWQGQPPKMCSQCSSVPNFIQIGLL